MTEARVRRTQAERSAGTRSALLAAAIRTLHEHGYGATTTMLVAEQAGVSRGAMLHQFRTKADLMTFVVEEVYAEELERYAERFRVMSGPREIVLAYPEVVWEVLSRPSGVAVLEILQGSRSDRVLAEKLAPIQARIENDALAYVRNTTGVSSTSLAFMRLIVWSVRGLSIASVLTPEPGQIQESVRLLRGLIKAGIKTGMLPVGDDVAAPAIGAPAQSKGTMP
ncbi:MAG: TetR/AcrR family transcriptional regulator [Candidatus Sphingomonas colombiensis]|nr:TetR/AcrR family transcriptional regulator [Sphingomonas sp.]WEK44054.1 MAG: TetR/AcrR family transcriptional regulator [Sphingomonas sp.]